MRSMASSGVLQYSRFLIYVVIFNSRAGATVSICPQTRHSRHPTSPPFPCAPLHAALYQVLVHRLIDIYHQAWLEAAFIAMLCRVITWLLHMVLYFWRSLFDSAQICAGILRQSGASLVLLLSNENADITKIILLHNRDLVVSLQILRNLRNAQTTVLA